MSISKALIVFTLTFIPLFAKESVITGNLIGSGQYLETKEGDTYTLTHSDLSRELMEVSGKKVRMLCRIEGTNNCEPIRYEIAPFYTDKDLTKWTMKPIPKYVYHSMTSFNPTVTPDGNVLFWTVLVENGNNNTQKIWYSTLDENQE